MAEAAVGVALTVNIHAGAFVFNEVSDPRRIMGIVRKGVADAIARS